MRISPQYAAETIHCVSKDHSTLIKSQVSRQDFAVSFMLKYHARPIAFGACGIRSIYTNIPELFDGVKITVLRNLVAEEGIRNFDKDNPNKMPIEALKKFFKEGKYDIGILVRDYEDHFTLARTHAVDLFIIAAEDKDVHFFERIIQELKIKNERAR